MPDKTLQTEFLIHDLKIPIAVIDAGAKSLLNRQDLYGPLTDKQIKVLKRILRNATACRHIVNDTLELGRSRQGIVREKEFFVSFVVTTVLLEIFDLLDADISEKISTARTYEQLQDVVHYNGTQLCFDETVWNTQVCLDGRKVQQILRNLISNAFKHRKSQVVIKGHIMDDFLVISVEDDGDGIVKEDQCRIFNSYFGTGGSLNEVVPGDGIGLAGVQVLLKEMGGAIDLESDAGKGARFVVSIPLKH